MDWPLGERESLKSEFKRVEALKDPANIAREVVAFLNAEGGEIWIGVGEAAGVADVIEEVPNPELQRDRLQDALVDLVEPCPVVGREIAIEVVPFPADQARGLLRVRVEAGRRGPYALLRQTMRAYLKRTGTRLRPMTREELAQAFQQASTDEDRVAKVAREIGSHIRKGGVGQFTLPGLLKVKAVKKPAQPARKGVPNPFKPGETMNVPAKPASVRVRILPLKKLKEMVV